MNELYLHISTKVNIKEHKIMAKKKQVAKKIVYSRIAFM